MLKAAQGFLTSRDVDGAGFAIFLTVLSFNLVSDSLPNALDPRSRRPPGAR